jgi:hypothetical protein
MYTGVVLNPEGGENGPEMV